MSCAKDKVLVSMEYEKILFSRLILSFFWTFVLQFFPVSLYIFVNNFDIIHPLDWIVNSTLPVFRIQTWVSLIPVQVVLFILGYVSAQELKKPAVLVTSRFNLLLSLFSKTNIIKCSLHLLLGLIVPWTYLKFSNVYLSTQCEDSSGNICVDENSVFIAACCIWTSLYYFVRYDVLVEKYLQFPVIRQLRFLQIRAKFPQTFKNCFKLSFVPVFYFLPFYFWYGKQVSLIFECFLSASVETSNLRTITGILSASLLVRAWLISSIYISLVEVLQLMIQIHFTELYTFALVKQPNSNEITLPTAMGEQNVPIIQHLACYDLFIVSMSQKSTRWQVFTLSQPGGHPHTWNAILHESLKIIDRFICEVEENSKTPEKPEEPKTIKPRHYHVQGVPFEYDQSVLLSPNSKLRSLVDPPHTYPVQHLEEKQSPPNEIWTKIDSYLNSIQQNAVVSYIFGSKPDAKTCFIVSNSQPLIWVVQSLSELVANALMEDQFGIVLKDLPLIINTLLRLKLSVEKLGNIQRKFQKQDHDLCMKASLKSALKRSLYRIAIAYSDYLTDLPLPVENLNSMKNFVNFKEC